MQGAGSIYFATLQGYVINETELYDYADLYYLGSEMFIGVRHTSIKSSCTSFFYLTSYPLVIVFCHHRNAEKTHNTVSIFKKIMVQYTSIQWVYLNNIISVFN